MHLSHMEGCIPIVHTAEVKRVVGGPAAVPCYQRPIMHIIDIGYDTLQVLLYRNCLVYLVLQLLAGHGQNRQCRKRWADFGTPRFGPPTSFLCIN